MKSLDFTLRFVTPAFFAGASGAEGFRVPSLRGVLRFWYRAKEGDGGADGYSSALFERESRIFGSARHGQGIRLLETQRAAVEPEWVEPKGDRRHLGFGPLAPKPRKGLPAGSAVSLRALGTEEQIAELRRCLVLLHCFGGLGGRSRRAWGSVEVTAEGLLPPSDGSFGQWLEKALARVWPADSTPPRERRSLPRHTAFSSHTRLAFLEVGGSAMTALDELADRYKQVTKDPSLRALEEIEGEDPSRAAPRVALGLPWKGKDDTRNYVTYSATPVRGRVEGISRRASPLLFKILPADEDGHRIVALYLRSHFLPQGELVARPGGKVAPPGDQAIESLLAGWTSIRPSQIST